MKKQNYIPASENENKAGVIEWIFAQMFSREPLPEEVTDGIRSYLADGTDAELKTEALGNAFLRSFHSSEPEPLSADSEREWLRLASRFGLSADRERAAAGWRARSRIAVDIKKMRRMRLRRIAIRVAAVLVPVALVVGGMFWPGSGIGDYLGLGGKPEIADSIPSFIATHTVAASADSIRIITLSDGTEVMLNRNSAFSYNDNREGELHGEAYFKVAKNPDRPFVIRSEHVTVTVLGTEFDFNTHTEDGGSRLSLYVGTVELAYAKGTHRLDTAGKEFTLHHESQQPDIHDFDISRKPDWIAETENIFNFMPLGAIFDAIEAAYGVTVAGREKIDLTRRLNFTLDPSNSIENIMSALEFSHGGFDYIIDGNTVTLNKR